MTNMNTLQTVESVVERGTVFRFEPPITVPEDMPVTGLEQVLAAHLAHKSGDMTNYLALTEQLMTASATTTMPCERAAVLSAITQNRPRVRFF